MLKKNLVILGGMVVCQLSSGCSLPDVPVTVTGYGNPYLETGAFRRFDIISLSDAGPGGGEQLTAATAKSLEEKGFVRDRVRPDLTVFVSSQAEQPLPDPQGQKGMKQEARKVVMDFSTRTGPADDDRKLVWHGAATALYEADKVELERCMLTALLQWYPRKTAGSVVPVRADICRPVK